MPNNMLIIVSLDTGKELHYRINFDSYDVLIEQLNLKFNLGERLSCSYVLNDKYVLDLGKILYDTECDENCKGCTGIEETLCHKITAVYFICAVNTRLQEALDTKSWDNFVDDFWNGNVNYRVC